MTAIDYAALANRAAEEGPDYNETSSGGGGEYVPPAEGLCIATLVGYIERGRREKKHNGAVKGTPRYARFIFELAGGKNPVKVLEDGTKIPHRVTVNVTLPEPGRAPNEKSGFAKLFALLNHSGKYKHPAQIAAAQEHYLATVEHHKWTNQQGQEVVSATFGSATQGYTLRPAVKIEGDMLEGTHKEVPIGKPPVISEPRIFLWDYASKEMWDALFIEGVYEEEKDATGKVVKEARSKNTIQEDLMKALDWVDSPMYNIIKAGGELDVSELDESLAPATDDALLDGDDPLAGIA